MSSTASPDSEDTLPVVEYCTNNVAPEIRACLASGRVESRGAACLERCGTCRTTPFLVVDGECRVAGSHAALLAALPGVSP